MATVARTLSDAIAEAAGWGELSIYGNGMRHPSNPFFSFHDCTVFLASYALIPPYGIPAAVLPPAIDWRLWNGTADIVTFLNAQDPAGGWYCAEGDPTFGGYAQRAANPAESVTGWWLCHVPTWMLPFVSGQAFALLKRPLAPPVWPGAARVTWGSTVPLAVGVSLVEPMDGVSIYMTTVPSGLGYYAFEANRSYVKAGMVTFQNDNGDFEWPQGFSFVTHVLCPKTMYQATGCVARCYPGVEGQMTSWTITP
jgi:hypothetical protein